MTSHEKQLISKRDFDLICIVIILSQSKSLPFDPADHFINYYYRKH